MTGQTREERPTLAFVEETARAAGALVADFYDKPLDISKKANAGDFLTQADLAANTFILEAIKRRFPHHGIISEETGATAGSGWTWIIDPIDGTRSFATHTPLFGVMISVAHDAVLEFAVVHLPLIGDTIVAERGKGAFLNGKRVRVSETNELRHSFGAGFSGWDDAHATIIRRLVDGIGKFHMNSLLCTAMSTVYVGSGRRDWMISHGGGVWDYAPAALICTEAGGIVTNIDGTPWTLESTSMLTANPTLHAKLSRILNNP